MSLDADRLNPKPKLRRRTKDELILFYMKETVALREELAECKRLLEAAQKEKK